MHKGVEKQGTQSEDVASRLERHPIIKARITKLLDLVENTGGDLRRADDAEWRAIDELRSMGRELLHEWGQRLADDEARYMAKDAAVVRQVKKLHWHSTFGEIAVLEQTYVSKTGRKLHRPFARSSFQFEIGLEYRGGNREERS